MALLDELASSLDPNLGLVTGANIYGTLASDPTRLATSTGPVGMALGQLAGDMMRSRAIDAATQLAQLRQSAVSPLLQALASPDPFQWAAANPNADRYALARLASVSPTAPAQARLATAQAGLASAQAERQKQLLNPNVETYQPSGGASGGPRAGPAGGPAGGTPTIGTGNYSSYYPPGTSDSDPSTMTPDQVSQALGKIRDPKARAAFQSKVAGAVRQRYGTRSSAMPILPGATSPPGT